MLYVVKVVTVNFIVRSYNVLNYMWLQYVELYVFIMSCPEGGCDELFWLL